MGEGSQSGFADSSALPCPLFLECNTEGQVVWMSERTRWWLGPAANLADIIDRQAPDRASLESLKPDSRPWTPQAQRYRTAPLRFLRILEWRGGTLLGAQPEPASESENQVLLSGLLALETGILRKYVRLQVAERRLAGLIPRRGAGSGRKLVEQIELERQRLGRELHTSVGQALVAIRLQLEVIAEQSPDPPEPVRQALDRISNLAADALEQVRSISKRLHPPEWQRLTLDSAIQQLWDLSGVPQRFEASLRIDPLPGEPAQEVKVLIYRTAQEALSNLIRHSRATSVAATLGMSGDRVSFAIQDNGVGFNAANLFSKPATVAAGIGLRSIRDQVAPLGGEMKIQSGPQGTKLEVLLPLTPADD